MLARASSPKSEERVMDGSQRLAFCSLVEESGGTDGPQVRRAGGHGPLVQAEPPAPARPAPRDPSLAEPPDRPGCRVCFADPLMTSDHASHEAKHKVNALLGRV